MTITDVYLSCISPQLLCNTNVHPFCLSLDIMTSSLLSDRLRGGVSHSL